MAEEILTNQPDDNKPPGDGSEPKPDQQSIKIDEGTAFKNVDELVNAYKNLRTDYTKKGQTLSDYEKQMQEIQTRIAAPVAQETTVDDNQLFWEKPLEVINKTVSKSIEPLTNFLYESQKERHRVDPEFQQFEPQIDQIVQMYPQMKMQPNIVGQLYKVVKYMNIDEDKFKEDMRSKIKAEEAAKIGGSVEDGNPQRILVSEQAITLSEEEKRYAVKFHPNVPQEEAYKIYGEKKRKAGLI
uniref:Uncharacterized protein n=1 Tax=viral metagenome TaxID=1070528 RepID=A0A6M3K8C5_9ZZZZ